MGFENNFSMGSAADKIMYIILDNLEKIFQFYD